MVAAHPIADFEASGVPDAGHVLAPESPKHEKPFPGPHEKEVPDSTAASIATDVDVDGRLPTAEERKSLRLVAAKLPKTAYLICLIEFAERASYFGCVGPFFNYIQQPLPPGGNGWGAPAKGDTQGTAGALGLGLQTATALTTLFTFLAYTIPIAGGIISDTKWGRYKTLWIGTLVGVVAHIILVIAAIPAVIQSGNGLAPFIIAILVLATASGLIKPTVAPLLADQSPIQRQSILTLPTGERVIQDPGQTLQQALMIFYWCINVGAFLQLGTTYIEKRIGFWLAYLVPMFAYLIMPAVLLYLDKRIVKVPAQGSVIVQAGRVSALAIKGRSWNAAIPSQILEKKGSLPSKVTWDDDFIGEMKRTIKACKLFLFLVLFNLADSGLTSVQNSMGAAMTTNGAPNDLLSNFNSICIIVLVPILNYGIYPLLRKHKINFSPIRRILFGFSLGVLTMVASAILQWQVYETSPCGYEATAGCEDANGFALVSPISIWAQIPLYALPAAGEVFVFVTVYEQAILRSPQRMKGLVYAFMLFTTALSSAIVEIISPALHDPHLIWPFVGIAAANVAGMICIWVFFRKMDETEGEDNAIGADREIEGVVHGRQERERREAVKA